MDLVEKINQASKGKLIFFLCLIGFLVYANILFNGFVWDDEEQILNNLAVHSIRNFPLFFSGSTFNPGGAVGLTGLYYKPLMSSFFSLVYSLFGPRAFFFHFFQLAFHLGNAILVFLVLRHLFRMVKVESILSPFILALFFLVHPINVEAVAYISALQDALFFFFGLLAFWFITQDKLAHVGYRILIGFLLLSSLLSKETGFLFLPIIFCYFFFFKKKTLLSFLFLGVLTVVTYAFLRFAIAGIFFEKHGLSFISRMNFLERMMSSPKITFFYLKTYLYPADLAISQHWVARGVNLQDFFFPLIFVVIFLAILAAFAFVLWRQKNLIFKTYLFFLLWFLIGLGFHLQIFPLDLTVSDRWFYFPQIGLLGMVGVAITQLKIQKKILFNSGLALVVLLLLALSVRTIIRNRDWENGLTLYAHDIAIVKESFDLENNLGVELFRAQRYQEAQVHFENSVKLAPHWWTNWNNLGVIYERNKDYQKARECYQKAIENGHYYLAYQNLAFILLKTAPFEETTNFLKTAIAQLPQNPKLRIVLALAYYQKGDFQKAEDVARIAVTLQPSQENLGVLQAIIQKRKIE